MGSSLQISEQVGQQPPPESTLVRMLLKLVLCIGLALGQEVTDEVIDNINEATGIALKDSFRCGLFFPDPADKSPDKSALPYLNLKSLGFCASGDRKGNHQSRARANMTSSTLTRYIFNA